MKNVAKINYLYNKTTMIVVMALTCLSACGKQVAQLSSVQESKVNVNADTQTIQSPNSLVVDKLANTNSEVRQPEGYTVIKKVHADLNGDGLQDWLIVSERPNAPDEERLFQIAQTQKAGDPIVYENRALSTCKNCGGVRVEDPFVDVKPINKGFVVYTEGGSREAWSRSVTFKYSTIDKSWQLVEILEKTVDTQTGETLKPKVLKPPKDFGKINFQDTNFDLQSLLQ